MSKPVNTENHNKPQTCPICLDDVSKIKRIVLTLPCSHVYCRKCLTTYIRTEITSSYPVKCPQPGCKSNLDLTGYGPLKGLIGQKYIKMAQKQKYNGCPVERCRGTLENGECNICHTRICRMCGEIAHPGSNCNLNIKQNYQNVIQTAKPCPKCHVLIYKDGGCNRMHCKRCKTHFNWDTLTIQQDVWNDHVPTAAENLNFQTYTTQFFGDLDYRVGENEEPIPCEICQRLCFSQTGICCSCTDQRSIYASYVYIDGVGERQIYNRTIHYCPLCKE